MLSCQTPLKKLALRFLPSSMNPLQIVTFIRILALSIEDVLTLFDTL